jgi:hypothetical protein
MATQPSPEDRASELVEKLPSSPNLITKTGTALLGAGTLAAAISKNSTFLTKKLSSVLAHSFSSPTSLRYVLAFS